MRAVIGKDPVATLYMYDSNSAFTIVMNSYMSVGDPIAPNNDLTGFGMEGNKTLNLLTLDDIANLTHVPETSEYKLLDSR